MRYYEPDEMEFAGKLALFIEENVPSDAYDIEVTFVFDRQETGVGIRRQENGNGSHAVTLE